MNHNNFEKLSINLYFNQQFLLSIALAGALGILSPPAFSDQLDDLRTLRDTTVNLVKLLVQEGLISEDKADALIKQAEKAGAEAQASIENKNEGTAASSSGDNGVVRVPYVPEVVKDEIRDEVKQDVLAQAKNERWGEPGALPSWINRISLSGDFRLRAQQDSFPSDIVANAPPAIQQFNGVNINNTTDEDHYLQIRARIGIKANISDTVAAGIRLDSGAAGAGATPVSTNQTLGTYDSRYTIGLGQAWLNYQPANYFGLTGGRIPNPYFASTNLVWYQDLNFEGVAAKFNPKFTDNASAFFTAGAFPIQYIQPTPTNAADSKWLYGFQLGTDLNLRQDVRFLFGAALYDYRHVEGIADPNPLVNSLGNLYDATAPEFRQKGNSLFNIYYISNPTASPLFGLASKFKELNFSSSLDLAFFDPVHVVLDADFVRNLGFDQAEIFQRTGLLLDPRNVGYQTKFTIGMPQLLKLGDWQGFIGYRYLQRDAVLDAFTDSEFHLGGTDAKGYFIGTSFAFEKNTSISLKWLSSREIDNLPLAIDSLYLDVITSF